MRGAFKESTGAGVGQHDPPGFGGQFGYYTDQETGLVCLTHRYYDGKTGRFVNRDPVGYRGGINLYGFCGNNPVNESDPSGHAGGTIVGNPVPNPFNSEEERVTEQLMKGIYRFVYRRAGTAFLRAAVFNPVTLSGVLLLGCQTRVADDSTGPGSPYAAAEARRRRSRAAKSGTYGTPYHYHATVRELVWNAARSESPDGEVRDPTTKQIIHEGDKWVMGHRPGWELRKHKESAARRGITRSQFIEEYNNPDHYRPELHGPNSSHRSEAPDDVNHWP